MFRMPVTGFLLDCCFRRRPVRPAIRHQPQWRSGACFRPAAALDLRNLNAQRAVLVVGVDVVLLHLIADVEAARAGADVTFTTKPLAGLILVAAVLVLMGGHGQIAVVQRDADVVLLEAGHVDVHVIALVVLAHVRTHHVRRGHRRAVVGGTPTLEERVVKQVREHRVIHQSRKHCHNRYSSHIGVERVGLPRRPGDWPCRCGLSWPFPEPLSELLLLPCATTYRYSVLTFPDLPTVKKLSV